MFKRNFLICCTAFLFLIMSLIPAMGDTWQMKQGDMYNTGRADYTIPSERLNDTFFDVFLWQKPTPHPGNIKSTSMSFFNEVRPEGSDIVVGSYHLPKGVQAMDRHTGKLFWNRNPDGVETIGRMTPAFSNDSATIYVTNDFTGTPPNPLMAFTSAVGSSVYWRNGADAEPNYLSIFSPTITPDECIFLQQSGNCP